jgi:hypothetical protein
VDGAERAAAAPVDLDGKARDPIHSPAGKETQFVALIFARTDCPISNAYAPEVRALQTEFKSRGVEFWLVYGMDETPAAIRKHLAEYSYPFEALRDPRHALAKRSKVTVTPEAAVYRVNGGLVYHGRIDARYADLGVKRPAPTTRDLRAALENLLAGKAPAPAAGPAVGCLIEGSE